MKKVITFIMTVFLVASVFCGCSESQTSESNKEADAIAENAEVVKALEKRGTEQLKAEIPELCDKGSKIKPVGLYYIKKNELDPKIPGSKNEEKSESDEIVAVYHTTIKKHQDVFYEACYRAVVFSPVTPDLSEDDVEGLECYAETEEKYTYMENNIFNKYKDIYHSNEYDIELIAGKEKKKMDKEMIAYEEEMLKDEKLDIKKVSENDTIIDSLVKLGREEIWNDDMFPRLEGDELFDDSVYYINKGLDYTDKNGEDYYRENIMVIYKTREIRNFNEGHRTFYRAIVFFDDGYRTRLSESLSTTGKIKELTRLIESDYEEDCFESKKALFDYINDDYDYPEIKRIRKISKSKREEK